MSLYDDDRPAKYLKKEKENYFQILKHILMNNMYTNENIMNGNV